MVFSDALILIFLCLVLDLLSCYHRKSYLSIYMCSLTYFLYSISYGKIVSYPFPLNLCLYPRSRYLQETIQNVYQIQNVGITHGCYLQSMTDTSFQQRIVHLILDSCQTKYFPSASYFLSSSCFPAFFPMLGCAISHHI